MAILKSSDQFKYTGRGPLDSKAIVRTYSELLSEATWTVDNKFVGYNGMIVAVWLNTADTSKNGIYFLQDSAVTKPIDKPDVTNEANWHRLGNVESLDGLSGQIGELKLALKEARDDIEALQDSATVVVDTFDALPKPGVYGKIYVVTGEAMTYIWHNNRYLPVGDGGDTVEIQIIHGGSASAN